MQLSLFLLDSFEGKGKTAMNHERDRALSEEFARFLRQKRRFLLFAGIFFVTFYFLLPLLISLFPEGMNRPVWGPFSWAWMYAFAHFAVVWILGMVYLRQANHWDRIAEALRRTEGAGEVLSTGETENGESKKT
jgi:uncharacterized membrane protein (DUF485 family)